MPAAGPDEPAQRARARIAAGEGLHTDFKVRLDAHRELAKDLVCFANTDGGELYVGVADDGALVGVEDLETLARQVEEVAFDHCAPPITVVTESVVLDGRTICVVRVPRGDARPYRTKGGQYCVRASARCRQASREELLRLFQATESLFYDETRLAGAERSDLDLDALDRFLVDHDLEYLRGEGLGALLRTWRLAVDGTPTLAGMVLFGRRPQEWLPYAQVNAARFRGDDSAGDPLDRTDLGGRLLEVVEQTERYLRVALDTPHVIEGFAPEPRPEIPFAALREAVVNALVHRDYTARGPVRVFVFDDRVDVHSPGTTPNTVDEEAMRSGVHVVRNPHLDARLSDAGLVTRAGTGVRRMSRLVREATGQDVRVEVRPFEVLVSLPRPHRSATAI